VRLRSLGFIVSLLAIAPVLGACDDGSLLQDAIITPATVTLGLPGSPTLGSALDLVRSSSGDPLVRRPERLQDAEEWDVALRRTEAGALVLRPFDALGTGANGAGIRVADRAFDAIDEAPRGNTAYSREDVPLTLNGVYLLRSRQFAGGASLCVKYAKAQVVELDVPAGRARITLAINENCDDERLSDD
jgi:hypothetical protein